MFTFHCFALPDNQNCPPGLRKRNLGQPITLKIPVQFGVPELRTGLWPIGLRAPRVAMPEAPVDEDCRSPWAKNDVRGTRQLACMEAISISHTMKQASDNKLRLGVATLDRSHVRRTIP